MGRDLALQDFCGLAQAAFYKYVRGGEAARQMVQSAFTALEWETAATTEPGQRLPVVDKWLTTAVAIQPQDVLLQQMISHFVMIEPRIRWRRREKLDMNTASANIVESHANGMIFGPGGIEERSDVWLGLTLLAPHTRYPDHNHPPAEVYLNLSEAEFRNGESDWFAPGIGGSFYNVPLIIHAMRSAETPLFAFWLLYNGG